MQDAFLFLAGYFTLAIGYMLLVIAHVRNPGREHPAIQFTLGIGCAFLVFAYLTAVSGTHVSASLDSPRSLDARDNDGSEDEAETAPTETPSEAVIYVDVKSGHVTVRVCRNSSCRPGDFVE